MCINTIRIVVHSLRKSDAVGNFVQAVAREAERRGWPYALYAEYCNLQINIAGNYKQLYQDLTSGDILLYHLTWGDPEFKLLMNVKCKKVVYYHNLTPGYFFLSDFPKIARELDSSREILPYISKADALFANSLYSLEDIAAYLKPGAVCGVMPPLTRAMLLKRFSHVDFSSPLFPSPYVLTLGRVAPHKNIEWGIRLFAEASSRHPDLSYVIAGSGGFEKYNEKLKKIILETDANADRIYWIDNVSDRDVACLIYHAEFLLHTSLHEGFGMPLLEAMAFDTPIYAVRQPAIEETLGNAGVLLSGEDLLADSSVLEEWFNSSNRGDNFSVLRKKRYDAITFAADHSIFWNEITPSPSSPEKDTFKREEVLKKQSNYRVKNIVLLCRQIKQFGGIPTFTRDLANALAALGNSVHIFAETSDDPKITKENNIFFHWLKVEDVPLPPIVSAKRVLPEHWAWSYAALRECRRLAKEKNIEIVEAPIWDCEGVAFLYDKTWPLVTSLHTVYYTHMQSYPHYLTLPGFEEQFVRPHLALERELMTGSDAIRANSAAIIKEIESPYSITFEASRCMVVHHGIDDVKLNRKNKTGDDIEILYVGRFEHRKGVDLLLEVAPRLLSAFPNLRMTLIGDNSLPVENQSKTEFTRSYLESFLAQHAGEPWLMRMQFPGVVSKEALLEAYSQCDIFCAPSRFESFGIIFLEAMRAEKPVVGTRVGGILEIVTDGVEGYLIPPNAPVPLEWALSQLIQSPDLRARMGRSARQTFEKRFLARIMAEKSMELYDLAVKNHKTCL